ncbi:MAG: zinc metallopeptidase [Clostridia bacterium]|nr:zinc metallopeptidase [Clostridia bacterium]
MPYYTIGGYLSYLLYMLPAYLIVLFVQLRLKSVVSKYSAVQVKSGMTGEESARLVASRGGAAGISVVPVSGQLTDNFNPSNNTISLSTPVYGVRSVTAVGVAAHEAGHAVQYAEDYGPAKLRSATVKICNIGSRLSLPLIFIGMISSIEALIYAGIICFSAVVFFQLVTLPVEFNASRRAVAILGQSGTLTDEELKGVRKVLNAAAMTYVGALAQSVFQIMYYLSRVRRK